MMLTRAVSAPAQYATPGILRYTSEPLSTVPYAVKFAPLPETEEFERRPKYKLGVYGRTELLNRQKLIPRGVNYNPNAAKPQDSSEPLPVPEKTDEILEDSKTGDTHLTVPATEPRLRRSSSEDGTSTQPALKDTNKRVGSSWSFWRKSSKRPTLPTITSQKELPLVSPVPEAQGGDPPASLSEPDPAPIVATPSIELEAKSDIIASEKQYSSLSDPPTIIVVSSSRPPTPQQGGALEEAKFTIQEQSEDSEELATALSDNAVGSTSDAQAYSIDASHQRASN